MRRHLPALLAFLIPACATLRPAAAEGRRRPRRPRSAAPRRLAPQYNLTGYPPAVRDGYIDGCEIGEEVELRPQGREAHGGRPAVLDGLERRLRDLRQEIAV